MNIVHKLTLREMKKNKRRTLVTIIGVIISVAMVSAVAILATSFIDLLQRDRITIEGDWHVEYQDLNEEQIQSLQTDEQTKKSYVSRDVGYAHFPESENEDKPYLFVKQFDERGFTEYPIHLMEGRLPEHPGEIVISEHILSNAGVDYHIGDELTVAIGERISSDEIFKGVRIDQSFSLMRDNEYEIDEELAEQQTETYKIVGVIERPLWEPMWAPGYTILSYLDPLTVSSDHKANLFVTNKKVTKDMYPYTEDLAKELNIENYEMHSSLLETYGVFRNLGMASAMLTFIGIIMIIIMVGSISLIYNAFAISVSERSRQLGMLSSVGATKKQKRNAVLFEGVVIGGISIPLGFLSGMLGMAVTFYFINDRLTDSFGFTESLRVTVTPSTILVAAVISIITIFISTYIPAKRASRISAIDAIRQSEDIKLTSKKVKTSKLVRKMFGFEAEVGLKNLKRNKKRYVATVFSLFISIVLFLSVSYFTNTLTRTAELTQEGVNYDIQVHFYQEPPLSKENTSLMEDMKSLPDITDASFIQSGWFSTMLEKDVISEDFYSLIAYEETADQQVPFEIMYHVLEDDKLDFIAQEEGIPTEVLHDSETVQGIVINWTSQIDLEKNTYVEQQPLNIKVGQKMKLHGYNEGENTNYPIGELTIAGTTETFPLGIQAVRYQPGVNVLLSKGAFEQLSMEKIGFTHQPNNSLFMTSSDPVKTDEEIIDLDGEGIRVFNTYTDKQEEDQFLFVIRVFVYGFIALITLISIANIFNTVTTSIALRKREFGMLKSVGMTPKGFNKMLRYESIFYGIKALLYGLPVSIGFMYLMHRSLSDGFVIRFQLPWISISIVIVAVFLIVGISMMYSSAKLKKENIIDALKQENA